VWRLIRELGLKDEFVAGDPRVKRYILRNGELHRAPFSASGLLTTSLVGLKSKYRLLSEIFRNSHASAREESLTEFVDRKFGAEVLDYLVDPFISTIFFGDPHKMGSAFPTLVEWEQTRGSVVRGAIRAYRAKRDRNAKSPAEGPSANESNLQHGDFHVTDGLPSGSSFKEGMGTLVERLAGKSGEDLRCGVNVKSIASQKATKECQAGGNACPVAVKSMPTQSPWQLRHTRRGHSNSTLAALSFPDRQGTSRWDQTFCLLDAERVVAE
jgi:protoporphyrinogen/coproporphyrinogen III oxidase